MKQRNKNKKNQEKTKNCPLKKNSKKLLKMKNNFKT